jgi:hypothetical protein
MLRLILAGLLAVGAAACGGATDDQPAPTVMGEETDPIGPSAPGATVSPQPPDNYP